MSRVYSDHGVIEVGSGGARVLSTYGVSLAELRERTGLDLAVS